MTSLRDAAQAALEALEAAEFHAKRRTPDASIEVAVQPAITALRAALAEPVQEPGFWGRVAARQASRIKQLEATGQQALEALEWLKQRGLFGDFHGVADTLRAALAEPNRAQKLTEAGYTRRPTLREMAEPALNPAPGYCKHCKQYTIEEPLPAEPVQPVAWMVYTLDGKSVCVTDNPADFTDEHRVLPLYTAPPQRKPLSEEEIAKCWHDTPWNADLKTRVFAFARAVEAAHGIK